MGKFKDISGQVFSLLTATNRIKGNKQGHVIWRCTCQCGKVVEVDASNLKSGNSKSCGCLTHRYGKSNPCFKDLTGQIFSCLTVIEYLRMTERGAMWLCKCTCGKMIEKNSENLASGNSKSCGCLSHRRGKTNPHFTGHEEITGEFWNNIQNNAKSRDIPFNITIKYAWDVFIEQNKCCNLTDIKLYFQNNYKSSLGNASLDRIDSKLGYIEGNIQWIHKDLNMMKRDFTQQEFIKYCKLIAKKFIETSHSVEN